jgi:ABC-type phosphate transport system substrate-binding protein
MKSRHLAFAVAGLISIAGASSATLADVAVIVSKNSPAATLTADQVSQIYLGKSKALTPIDNAEKSSVRNEFYSKVAGKDEAQVKAIWSKLVFTGKGTPPKSLGSSAEVLKAVADNANAIGYVERSAVDATVKVIFEAK